ncbi:MAG: xylose isomerase [Clostridiales bacterium]|jgi:xylose isomerase|nr:xylose isomerase [Clostridiales bacterium]
MKEFFNVRQVKYEGPESINPASFKYYDANRKVAGKSMRDHLKFALSWWHTLCGDGADMFGRGTAEKTFGGKTGLEIYENKVYAGFEMMEKLGIGYFCFHDRDLAPEGRNLAETNENLDCIAAAVQKEMKRTGIECLWGTANCFTHPRYLHGAGTSPNADVFAFAAAQIKKAIDVTIALGGRGYVFWGGREGYETLLNTDVGFEQDNMARLMRMAVGYARGKGFKGDFYIEPKPKEPTKHQYDFDAASTLAFLFKYGLEKDFKLNIEANHATLAGHTFQHELRIARVNGVFGSVDANSGDSLLGWDTDQFPTSVYDAALCMYEVLKAGGFTNGGLNFDAKARRGSFTPEDIFYGYIAGMDTFAKGLLAADKMISDGRLEGFIADRYGSYRTGIGKDVVSGKATLETLEAYALKMGEAASNASGRQEMLESILNALIFNS